MNYVAVEGEALAIAWALKHTKYFTQGCDDLVVVTDHRPLVGLFNDTELDQIDNPRLFSFKQKTLMWNFTVVWRPGKENKFSDATSRNPSSSDDSDDAVTDSEILAGIMCYDDSECLEYSEIDQLDSVSHNRHEDVRTVTWDLVKAETNKDEEMLQLITQIERSFPDEKHELPPSLLPYWAVRHNLYVVDGVVLMRDQVLIPSHLRGPVAYMNAQGTPTRVVIPPNLRRDILNTLHSAHQGISSMCERARAGVYWPGITKDIQLLREHCSSCNNIMPSQARIPPAEACVPTTPFEAIVADFFHYMGYYYLVVADRLSGWVEIQQINVGTNDAGAEGLCKSLRRMMVTFGVPTEIASDGGPEFTAAETTAFFKRWGIHHRLSSVSLPSSNGRAELAVKSAKRMLMNNVGADGTLNNDAMVRALLTHRNTPDPGCKLSPAQILLGRPLRDTLPTISKEVMIFNNEEFQPQWRDAWRAKEEALKTRYVKTIENLNEHTRTLPPLRYGDQVMIQNQSGRFPKKWDKSGMIVEVKGHDQYVIKVAGSGRLTLRNRRFLRRYNVPQRPQNNTPHPTLTSTPQGRQAESRISSPARSMCSAPPTTNPDRHTPPGPPATTVSIGTPTLASQPNRGLRDTTTTRLGHQVVPQRLCFGDMDIETTLNDVPQPPVEFTRRSTRQRKPRQLYDAASGKYNEPVPVPEDE